MIFENVWSAGERGAGPSDRAPKFKGVGLQVLMNIERRKWKIFENLSIHSFQFFLFMYHSCSPSNIGVAKMYSQSL